MFTGIVRELGSVEALAETDAGARLVVRAPATADGVAPGDSVAVDGVCLTSVASDGGTLTFDVVAETLARSTLGRLAPAARVNVEPALRAGEPLGGHLVQGHVDGRGRVALLAREGDGATLRVEAPPELLRYCVEKGSVAVDGVSLTVAALGETWFEVALVPHTLGQTTLGGRERGDEVNLEVDVLAKYVERLLEARA